MQVGRNLIWILSLLSGPAFGAGPYNSSGLANSKKDQPSVLQTPRESQKVQKVDQKKRFQKNFDQVGDLKKIETQIKAINLIIKTETDNQKKIDLFIRRSQLYVSAARSIGLKRTRLEDMTDSEKKYLDSASKTLSDLVKFSKDKPRRLANIYYLLGMIEYEYERYEKTRNYFIQSIKLDMKNPLSTTMALMIGELDYDADRFEEAIKGYQWLYKIMNPRERALADYKTAWSYIGLNDMENAKVFFMKVVRANGETSFVEDSLRDLAFIVAQQDDEILTIKYGNENLTDLSQRSKFYYYSLVFFLQKDKKKGRQPLFAETLAVEKDPYQRARILALKVSYERKEFPTVDAFKALIEVDTYLKKLDASLKDKFFFQEGANLEDNSEAIIKNFVDAYTGKITMPEKLTKDYIVTAMKKLIEIHLRLFPSSSKQDQIYGIWMDACFDTKDLKCLQSLKPQFKEKREKNPAFVPLVTSISLKILSLVDLEYEKDPTANEGGLLGLIQEFIQENPKHPENTKLLRKSTALLLKKGRYQEALPQLESLAAVEANDENVHKLLYAKFKLNMHEDVVKYPGIEKSKNKEIMEIFRESNLVLAQKNLDANQFDQYEKHLKLFLSSQPEKKKAVLALTDYFKRLITLQKYNEFMKEWRALDSGTKDLKEFQDVRAMALGGMMSDGYFVEDSHLLSRSGDADLNFNIFVYNRALNKPVSEEQLKELRQLPDPKRSYIYNLILVTKPKRMIEILSAQKKLSEDDMRTLYSAYLLKAGHDNFLFGPEQLKLIRPVVPQKMIPMEKTKLTKEMASILPPKKNLPPEKYEKRVAWMVDNTRFVRKKVLNEMKKISVEDKILLLSEAIKLEKSTSVAILESPTPAGLDDNGKLQYQQGLQEIAREFDGQAEEFTKSKVEIEVKKQVEDEDIAKQRLPEVKPESLPVPSSKARFNIAEDLFKKTPIAALIFWDSQFSTKKIEAEDFYKGRAKLLVQIANTQSMRDLIAIELRTAQQDGLIQTWKGMTR